MEIEVVSELIEQYGTEVMIFCRRLTGCVPDAQDLYQQTFLKLMEMRVRIEREKNPRAFIFAVANSIWKNERRKLMRRALIAPSFSLEDAQTQDVLELPDTEDTQQQQLAVDLQFEQGEWMRMQITQQTRDGRTLERESRVTSDENTQYFSLEGFEEGTIKVRFYNNGVSGVKAQVRVA